MFLVDGINYLHVKVTAKDANLANEASVSSVSCPCKRFRSRVSQHGNVQRPLLGFVQDGGVLLVAATRENVSPSLVLELLKRIGGIIKASLPAPTQFYNPLLLP